MKGLRFLVTSNVHLGSSWAKQEEFTEMLLTEGPEVDLIIINGDLVHENTVNVREVLEAWITRMEEQDLLYKIFVVIGNHDEPWVQRHPRLATADYATPTTVAHRYICLHGHHLDPDFLAEPHEWETQFGAQGKTRLLEWATKNKWPPKMIENDYLIVGHCHSQFYNRERQVISTGTWHDVKRDGEELMGYLIVENKGQDDEIRLRQWKVF